jgi:hypothetical protein
LFEKTDVRSAMTPINMKGFNHLPGECGLTCFATPQLALLLLAAGE